MNTYLKTAAGIALALTCTISLADDKLLKQCKAIKKELAKLESLREGGGSAGKMDGWKRRMHDQQDEYSRLYCRQYRFQLDKH